MLVTFSSPAHSDVVMFADLAKRMLKLMGKSTDIPGAISADEVPSVLAHLKNEVGESEANEAQNTVDDDDHEPPVGIAVRAFPIIEMLNAAAEAESTVMWYTK